VDVRLPPAVEDLLDQGRRVRSVLDDRLAVDPQIFAATGRERALVLPEGVPVSTRTAGLAGSAGAGPALWSTALFKAAAACVVSSLALRGARAGQRARRQF
jgi:hypothetical protein